MTPEGENARIALLTPGPYNETYFEHAYLARYLGLTLVEGNDLTVRDQRLYLKTLSGLEPVHALIKRLDDEWLDPLELRADSTLGVPGLLQVLRAGNLRAGQCAGLGAAGVQRPARLSARHQPAPAGRRTSAAFAGHLVVRRRRRVARGAAADQDQRDQGHLPAFRTGNGHGPEPESARARRVLGPHGAPPGRPHGAGLVAAVADPDLDQRPADAALGHPARVCAGRWPATRGACCPVAWCAWRRAASSLPPCSAAAAAPTAGYRPRARSTTPACCIRAPSTLALASQTRTVTSRAAENLFWLGRYTERAENSIRIAQIVLDELGGEEATSPSVLDWISAIAQENSLVLEDMPSAEQSVRVFTRSLMAGLAPPDPELAAQSFSVGFNLRALKGAASQVRERLSQEHWNLIERTEAAFARDCAALSLDADFVQRRGASGAAKCQRAAGGHHRLADRPHGARQRLAPAVDGPPHRTHDHALAGTGARPGTRLPARSGRFRGRGGAVRQHHHLPRPVPAAPRHGGAGRPAGDGPRQPALAGLGGADPARAPGQARHQRHAARRRAGPGPARPRHLGAGRSEQLAAQPGRRPAALERVWTTLLESCEVAAGALSEEITHLHFNHADLRNQTLGV